VPPITPPRALTGPRSAPAPAEPAKRLDTTKAAGQLITIGDRLFRSGNLHRAAERYEQALATDPDSAAPRVRLAQVALVRGQYAEAANRFREAQATEPGWLLHAPDIQAIYGEPADFAAPIAKLETHLQVNPNDRDAWLVLGAQWYLSGRTRQASDVFQRLSDRAPDPTLTAFLDATVPAPSPSPARR
jgi:Tfp pilus assembly protein PilF